MTAIERLADVQIMEVVHLRLTDFDHLCRELEQDIVLSGIRNDKLERKLIAIREAIEDAATIARSA